MLIKLRIEYWENIKSKIKKRNVENILFVNIYFLM